MTESTKVRRRWGNEEKIFFCKMLQTPLKTGHPKTVSQVAVEYGVSAKLLYTWLALYTQQGERGFEKKPRKVYKSKSRNVEFTEQLCSLSIMHPHHGAQKLIDRLKAQNPELSTPSIPTVLKILRENNLGTSEQRFGAAEKAFVEGDSTLPNTLIQLLLQENPCLRLLNSNRRVDGLLFLVKSIPLSRYFSESTDSFFVVIETNSLMMYGTKWDGKALSGLADFISEVIRISQRTIKTNVFFLAEKNTVFNKIPCEANWLDTNTYGIDRAVYFDALKSQFNTVRRYLRLKKLNDTENFDPNNDNFLMLHKLSTKCLGYPRFGESAHITLKNHQQNLYFERFKSNNSIK